MISKAKIKFIKSLQIKKYRKQEQCFVVEGAKSTRELLLAGFNVALLAGTSDFLDQVRGMLSNVGEVVEVSPVEMKGLGTFQTNETALAVVEMRPNRPLQVAGNEFGLVLDEIRDPGNLGTIIRTADWFGISKIIASEDTADFYNPKVISASMGSFTRVEVYYTALPSYLQNSGKVIFGTFLEGEDVHKVDFGNGGLIVIGNEAHGVSPQVARLVNRRITIPRAGRAESLNAGIATAIVLDNLVNR